MVTLPSNGIFVPRPVRPSNNRVAALGDSRVSQFVASDATNYGNAAQGALCWAKVLSRQCFVYDPQVDNFGVAGDTTTQALARVPAMLASTTAGTIFIWLGTNDPPNSIPVATSLANLTQIRNLCLAAGRVVVFLIDMPRGDAANPSAPQTFTATLLAQYGQILSWTRAQENQKGCYVVDPWPLTGIYNNTQGWAIANMLYDGVHESQLGGYNVGSAIATLMQSLFAPEPVNTLSDGFIYDATNNPYGSLVTAPMLSGSGGTTNTPSGGSLTGTCPASWTNLVTSGAGFTLAYGANTSSNGKLWNQVTVGGTPTAATPSMELLRQVPTAGNMTVGDIVEGVCEFEVDAGATQIRQLALIIFDSANSKSYGDMLNLRSDATGGLPTSAFSGIFRTPPIALLSTNLRYSIVIRGFQNQAATLVARFRGLDLRKVV